MGRTNKNLVRKVIIIRGSRLSKLKAKTGVKIYIREEGLMVRSGAGTERREDDTTDFVTQKPACA